MGGPGSGPRRELDFNNPHLKTAVKELRSRGWTWEAIASLFGYKSDNPLSNFKKENEEFVSECDAKLAIRTANLFDRFVEAALPKDGRPPQPQMACRIAEKLGIIDKEAKGPAVAISQQGAEGAPPVIQVAFVEPRQLQGPAEDLQPALETIDAKQD